MVDPKRLIPIICSALALTAFIIFEPLVVINNACITHFPKFDYACKATSIFSTATIVSIIALLAFAIYDKIIWNIPWVNAKFFGSKRGTWIYCTSGVIRNAGQTMEDGTPFEVMGVFYLKHNPTGAEVATAQVYYHEKSSQDGAIPLRGTWTTKALDVKRESITMIYNLIVITPQGEMERKDDHQYYAIHSLATALDTPIFGREALRGKVSAATESGRVIVGDIYCERLTWGKNLGAQKSLKRFAAKKIEMVKRVKTSGSLISGAHPAPPRP